ncbi:MAG TPA: EAL domain-containing protein [Gallionella sp.]|nr:EAL domain-containing protein [Gallionella sp.]
MKRKSSRSRSCESLCNRYLLTFLLVAVTGFVQAQPLQLTGLPAGSLGAWAEILVEEGPALSLDEAQAKQREGLFHADDRPVLTYGIGARPRWVHLALFNPTAEPLPLQIVTGATWADRLDVYIVHDRQLSASWQTGDSVPRPQGLTPAIGYTLPASFAPGRSDLYLRAEMVDPFVLPIELMTEQQALSNERQVHYSYGLIYGFLLALLAYNFMLFVGLGERSYLYYGLYLFSLVVANLAYTGHGYAWLWPGQATLQRYVILALMVLYGCCGLLFASRFLALAEHAPRARRWVNRYILAGVALFAASVAMGSQFGAALVAFSFVTLFSIGMMLLGVIAVRRGYVAGRYFLIATLFGMLGAVSTSLSVWGWVPFNTLTYHAVEYGALIEAALLALALAHRVNEMTANLSKITVSHDDLSSEVRERKRTEEMLRRSEESLKESQRIAGLGSYVLDIPAGVWQSSEVLDQLLGIDDRYERSVQSWLALIHPEDRLMIEDYLGNKVIGRGEAFDKEFRILRHSDQALLWLHGLGELEFDAKGHPVRMHGTIQDITEQKKIEAELRIAATAFEAQEGMMITDADNRILRVNTAFTHITGYSAQEVVGQYPGMLSAGRYAADFYAAMWESINSKGSWEGEIWNRRKNGETYPEYLIITVVKDGAGTVTNYVATFNDITASKAAADEIKNLAFFDPLTRLPNRRLLLDRLRHALLSSAHSARHGALLFIDMDNFKTLNDTLGHHMGDLLLQEVAQRLLTCVREGDTVARLGGDEFVVVLEELSNAQMEAASQAESVIEKILDKLNQPYKISIHEHHSSPSIGVTLFSGEQFGMDELLKQADIAMYQAKKAGRNTWRFFDPSMQTTVMARLTLENDLRHAILEQESIKLYYQAQVDSSGRVIGAEALARWDHPQRGFVPPDEFIPLAEDCGLILPFGHWVLVTACRQLAAWATRPESAHLTLAVNVSASQFRLPTFVEEVLVLIDHFGINPEKLKLEITESMLLDNINSIIAKMTELKMRGINFSMDDFGTGYSSLQYLKQLPLSQLKIDQSFVRNIAVDTNDKAIVRTIIAMAQSLELDIIAEGIETQEQRELLLGKGCTRYQGYLFGRPMPIEQFDASLKIFQSEQHEK